LNKKNIEVGMAVIGTGNPSGSDYLTARMLLEQKHVDVHILNNDDNNNNNLESTNNPFVSYEPYIITRLPEVPEPYIDHKTSWFNSEKHKQTCDKKRKVRKSKNRVKKKKQTYFKQSFIKKS
jgi:hypothetical protein